MQSSVKLLHMLSAFLRSCRSAILPPLGPITEWPLEIGWPTLPTIDATPRASDAAFSRALYKSGVNTVFDFARAACNNGWASPAWAASLLLSTIDWLAPRPLLGDVDIVVAVVVAVGGLSPVARETAAPEVAGGLPVNSSFRILDFRSSNSSQTVDGAVVDTVPSSVLSTTAAGSGVISGSAILPTSGEELYTRGVEKDDKFDCRYACPRACEPAVDSGMDGLLPDAEDCVSYEASRELKTLGVTGVVLVADGGYRDLLSSNGLAGVDAARPCE